ncbi:MAG: MGMT family protein [Planctomycetales bacterium]|nr:MGMT family protein [Planctomycetales bacterium]
MKLQTISTPLGAMIAHWTAAGLHSFQFLREGQPRNGISVQRDEFDFDLAGEVEDYFRTGKIDVPMTLLDWSGVPDFHRRVLQLCSKIPSGMTVSYGDLARQAGNPRAARAVGTAMARNRWPLIIPCHRVVGSTGKLTGYSGIGGIETKRALLGLEKEANCLVAV